MKEFEDWIMYFLIEKESDADPVSLYVTSHLDLPHFHALTAVLFKIWDTLHQCISTCSN